jgi:hypothetical protein
MYLTAYSRPSYTATEDWIVRISCLIQLVLYLSMCRFHCSKQLKLQIALHCLVKEGQVTSNLTPRILELSCAVRKSHFGKIEFASCELHVLYWRMSSSGMWRCVDHASTDVSEGHIASIFRVEKSASGEPAWAGGCRLSHQSETTSYIRTGREGEYATWEYSRVERGVGSVVKVNSR